MTRDGVGDKLRGYFSVIRAGSALAAVIALAIALISCGELSTNTNTASSKSSGGAQINLSWPEGYTYDPATKEVFLPSSERQQSAQVYVTRVTLIITGEGMDPLALNVPLDTLTVEFIITPGVRVFTILVETNIPGLSFSARHSLNLKAGGIGDINFGLDLNAPPQNVSIKASKTTVSKREKITITLSADELDPEDEPTVAWDAGGGVAAREGASEARTVSWSTTWWADKKGVYTVCGTINDGKGGVGRACVSITVKDNAPSIRSVTSSEYNPIKGGTVTLTCSASDPDGDRLYYNWSDGMGWTAPGAQTQYTFNVSGNVKFTCSVSDGVNTSYGDLTLNARLRINGSVLADWSGDSWYLEGAANGESLKVVCAASTTGGGTNITVSIYDTLVDLGVGRSPDYIVGGVGPWGCGGSLIAQEPDLADTDPASTLSWTAAQSDYCFDVYENCNGGCNSGGYDCYLTSTSHITATQTRDDGN